MNFPETSHCLVNETMCRRRRSTAEHSADRQVLDVAALELANCGRCSPAAALEDPQRNARPSPVGWMRPAEMLRPNAQCVKRIKHHSAAAVTPGLISVARG